VIDDVPTYGLRRGAVLCLSGGGYRAALFHLGALTRLNELGLLARTETVGAVSGGSILAALLAAKIPWPLQGAFREWPEAVAEPMRAIARRNLRARALLRSPISGSGAALEERYARELIGGVEARGGEQPRLVFGGAGLTLGEVGGKGGLHGLRWEIGDSAPSGYDPTLVSKVIATVRTDLDAFGEAEQAVLENHGYLLADATVRAGRTGRVVPIEPLPPEPPHPDWMSEAKVRAALAASARHTRLGRLRPRRTALRRGGVQPASASAAALLERYRPIVQYDSLESYRADATEAIVGLAMGHRCNTLHRRDGTLIASVLPDEDGRTGRLDLDFLGPTTYANGMQARGDDYIDESGGSHAADALAMRRRQGGADVVYGRACHDAVGRAWLQYWFFYYYNDKGFFNIGLHEGDWEMIQLRLGEDGTPDAATYAQHSGGVAADWEEVERRSVDGGEAPVVYSARGSHASLLRAGTQAAPIVPDHNDGLGAAVRPRLIAIGEGRPGWVAWPGRWGSTRRREAFEGTSPRGPGRRPQWWDPAGFHREARPGREIAVWAAATPPTPALSAHREGDRAVVSYRFRVQVAAEDRAERIVAAPCRSGTSEPVPTQTFKVEEEEGSFALQLPLHTDYDSVRLSVASNLGTPGATLTVPFER
jgi:hypothetical protein